MDIIYHEFQKYIHHLDKIYLLGTPSLTMIIELCLSGSGSLLDTQLHASIQSGVSSLIEFSGVFKQSADTINLIITC